MRNFSRATLDQVCKLAEVSNTNVELKAAELRWLLDSHDRLLKGLRRAEQTLRGLGYGELQGDASIIALNEALNLLVDINAATGDDNAP